jgi:hypothetical protein
MTQTETCPYDILLTTDLTRNDLGSKMGHPRREAREKPSEHWHGLRT